jgi:hypothetical protein
VSEDEEEGAGFQDLVDEEGNLLLPSTEELLQAMVEGIVGGGQMGDHKQGEGDTSSSSSSDTEEGGEGGDEELEDNPLLDALARAPLRAEEQQRRMPPQQLPGGGHQGGDELAPLKQVGG